MIDILLVCIFCYQLYRLAHKRGLSPWPYVLNYIGAFFLMAFVIGYTAMSMFGKDLLQNEEAMKKAVLLEPFAILFEVLLFIYFRNRIAKAKVYYDDDDTTDEPPTTPGNKKDLSYFR